MTPNDGQRRWFHARRSAAEIARKLLLTVALVAVASVLLPAPPAQADDFERELRRTECRTEAFAEYTQEAGRCLDELRKTMNRYTKTSGWAAVVFFTLFQAGAAAGSGLPFGFEHSESPEHVGCVKLGYDGWQCRSVPKPYREFSVYNIIYIEGIGVCEINAIREYESPYGVKYKGLKILSHLEKFMELRHRINIIQTQTGGQIPM